jgi:hypothetical protein
MGTVLWPKPFPANATRGRFFCHGFCKAGHVYFPNIVKIKQQERLPILRKTVTEEPSPCHVIPGLCHIWRLYGGLWRDPLRDA